MKLYHYWFNLSFLKRGLIVFITAVGCFLLSRPDYHQRQRDTVTPTVIVAKAKVGSVPLLIQAPGTLEAAKAALIMPQITGVIRNITFKPGQLVKRDQWLFEIESSQLVAALQQVNAILTRDKSILALNELDAKRYQTLAKLEYVTQQQAEQARTTAASQKATVIADQASVRQAQIQLSYSHIKAPFSGRTGNINVKVGDLVVANSTNLVTINQLDPIWVNFYLSQQQLPIVLKAMHDHPLQIQVWDETHQQLLGKGQLIFIDNTVSQQTGTVLLRGQIPNPHHQLWPGLTVNVQLVLSIIPQAVVIPIAALQVDQKGNYIFQMEGHIAKIVRVTLAQQVGNQAVVSAGLRGNETVVVMFPPGLVDGTVVNVENSKQHANI